eukprot:TRINITY_DN5775_c0_g1_i1.p1 TRINITY_DN5775_c0_g1~~TRINITY_DN5775_c0_g1_i1.p1  ORF type:complete len:205 (+),score=34.66 TRINITY_DN5775_c0_g1_i1:126-740(+)
MANQTADDAERHGIVNRWLKRNQYAVVYLSNLLDFEEKPFNLIIYFLASLTIYFSVSWSERSSGTLLFMGLLCLLVVNRIFLRHQRKRQDQGRFLTEAESLQFDSISRRAHAAASVLSTAVAFLCGTAADEDEEDNTILKTTLLPGASCFLAFVVASHFSFIFLLLTFTTYLLLYIFNVDFAKAIPSSYHWAHQEVKKYAKAQS